MAPRILRRRFRALSSEATEGLGECLGRELVAGAVVGLDGELGSGKTALIRGMARGLDVSDPISSPTFTLMMEHRGRLPLFHFDAWMSGRESSFLEDGGADYLGSEGVCAIEWAQRVERFLPPLRLALRMGHLSPEERLIECELLGAAEEAQGHQVALEAALASVQASAELIELSWLPGEPSRLPGVQG